MSHFCPDVNPFELSVKELSSVMRISKDIPRSIKSYSRFELGEEEVEAACRKNITLITCWNKHYPVLLKKNYDPPILLYCTGLPLQPWEDTIAIVGTRRYTAYGKSVTQSITQDLNLAGMTVVSGLARGIDPKLFNPLQRVQKKLSVELSEEEQKIMENLGSDPVHIDQLANQVEMEITSLLQQLLSLELKNAVQQVGGKQFVRA